VNLQHALTILITGKNFVGPVLTEAEGQVGKFATAVGKALDKISKEGVGVQNIFGSLVAGITQVTKVAIKLTTVIAALSLSIIAGTTLAVKYAAKVEAVSNTFYAIANQSAPAMIKALREKSRYMVEDLKLMEVYNKAYMMTGTALASRLPELYEHLSKVALATNEDVNMLVAVSYTHLTLPTKA